MLGILKFHCYHFTFRQHRNLIMFFFCLFVVMLSNFLIISVVREKIKVKLALSIPTGAPTTLADKMIQTPLLVALKTIKGLSMQSKAVTYLLNF